MSTHPLWRPFEQPTDEEIEAVRVGTRIATPVEVVPPDPTWPAQFEVARRQLTDALGEAALAVEHVGSTSVPGLWAKPIIDIDLTVADSADEASYLPALEAAGFELRVREPEEEEHRCFRGTAPAANVHVWSPGAVEAQRHLVFRDWLKVHEVDRATYGALKADLAAQGFTDVMHYNNAKGALVYDLYEAIFASDTRRPHERRPRA